jgi:putative nucleotidyltransferase with HDIG domain
VEEFAPLPSVAMRVMSLVADPDTCAADLESVLQGDVALVASVLKLANSAFYGLRRQIVSLKHALLLLGKNEVQSIVLSQVLFQAFKVPDGEQKTIMVNVWKHSLECALAAECVADHCGDDSSVYFLGGMLHDIGKLIIVQKFLKEFEDLDHYGQLVELDSFESELERLGCGHNELGAQLLNRWMFPVQLVKIVREHHDYSTIVECDRSSQIMVLANLLCKWTSLKDQEEPNKREEEEAFLSLLLRCGVDSKRIPDEESLSELEDAFRQRLEERAELLEMLQM